MVEMPRCLECRAGRGRRGRHLVLGPSPAILPLYFNDLYAFAHVTHPRMVHHLVACTRQLVDKPRQWGGSHEALFDNRFDDSGSISHVLNRCGLLAHPSSSTAFVHYGVPGPGRYVTIDVKPGSTCMGAWVHAGGGGVAKARRL